MGLIAELKGKSVLVVSQIPAKLQLSLRPYWRLRWLIIGTAWAAAVLGWLVVVMLPNRYQAMTRIYADTETLLTPLLHNIAVQTDLQKQLEVLQKTLLNRDNLAQVARAAALDLDAKTNADKEALYDRLGKQIAVTAEGHNLFTVSYSDANPDLAKKVVETLLNIFVETNLGQNRTNMESARNFLENQIASYEQQLKQADQRLAEYKSQHVEILSVAGSNFSGRLDAAHQEQMAARSKLDEATLMRDQLKTHLATIPQYLEVSVPTVMVGGNTPSSAKARVLQLQNDLAQLQAKYTDQHPDVITAKRALEQAQADAGKEESPAKAGGGGGSQGRVSNPVYEQIILRLVQADSDLAQAQNRVRMADQESQRLESLAQTAPSVEAELADLNREYGVIKGKYEELLGRRESARISEAVESSGDKVQFRIIDAPRVPTRPSFPNRPLFVSAVLVLSIGAGCGLAVLTQKFSDTVDSVSVLTEEFNIRVLGAIPKVESVTQAMARRRNTRNFSVATGGLFLAYGLMIALSQLPRLSEMLPGVHLPDFLLRIGGYVG